MCLNIPDDDVSMKCWCGN